MEESLIYDVDILDEARDCFLTYSSEVLTDRSIPAAEDGLLSAQRKILWTMEDPLKMDSKSKTKKCNALVGSTLATSYFHGDAACYGVLRKMAQEFLMRYPLLIGQGQLGTQENNDMFSSSRYTEAKPSIFADLMMGEYKKNVVPTKETYNGEYMEPVVLPSFFPNAICNGRQAIGVSMSHNSAPHNLTEVCNAIVATIEKGSPLTIDELLEKLPGPDFPLGGTILNIKDIKSAFSTGKSKVSLKIQGDYEIDGQKIIFTSIPYRTYRNKIKEQITENIEELSEVIDDFDDESNIGKNRLVFHVKSGVAPAGALTKLFTLTDLQSTLSYNMNYIVNGTPRMCSMIDLIQAYITHQENVTIRAFTFDMEKAKARIHVLQGLIAAVDKIDEVIDLIKRSNNRSDARDKLMSFLSIDDVQANAILDMKLGKLTRIDKEELVNELHEKEEFVKTCEAIINNRESRLSYIKNKVIELRDKYGDERRTKLLNIEIQKAIKEKPIVEPKDCVVIVTKGNMIKRIDKKNFKPQKRNTAGIKTNGDIVAYSVATNTEDVLLIFSTKGKMYRVVVDAIPEGTSTSAGAAISSLVKFDKDESPITYTTLNIDTDKYIFFATKNGTVKKVPFSEYEKTKKSGILAITLKDGDELVDVTVVGTEDIGLVTQKGMFIRFKTDGMPISSRIAQGVKGMALNDDDALLKALPISPAASYLAIVSKDGQGKKVALTEFTTQGRGGKGVICSKLPIAGADILGEDDNLLISGDKTSIVISGSEIPTLGRTAQGVSMIKNNMEVVSISKI